MIYEISGSDRDAPLQAYKDNTATGGALLTPVKSYKLNWGGAKRVWSNGARIFVINDDDTVNVFEQCAPATGDGAISLIAALPRSSKLTELISAQDVWMVGSVIYTLSIDGAITHRTYVETKDTAGAIKTALGATVTDKTGLSGVTQAWSPGPGVINTLITTDDPDTTGRISKATTDPFATINDEVTVGILGDVMAAPASCLADADPNVVPHFGTPPADENVLPVAQEAADPDTPRPSNTVTGKFTLGNGQRATGNGQRASGLEVTVTAADVVAGSDSAAGAKEPELGRATTAADGTWSLTLPSALPAAVRTAMDDNRGALNLNATTTGTTTSGVSVLGVDALVAVPPRSTVLRAASSNEAAAAAEAIDDGHSVPMLPNTVDDAAAEDPTPEQERRTFAAQAEADPMATDDKTPTWQSDRGALAADYNPYLEGGKDISAEKITPLAPESCDNAVHAVRQDQVHGGRRGPRELGLQGGVRVRRDHEQHHRHRLQQQRGLEGRRQQAGVARDGRVDGYTNKGSFYARQYKVPIEYIKYKHQRICFGGVRSTWYTIEAGRYKVPSGGSVGKIGKNVSSKDGYRGYYRSPKSHRARVEPGTYFQLSREKSSKFGNAVNFMGVALGVTTGYDTNHKQKITAGNRTSDKHLIWGKNGPVSSKPGVFYSN
ncbi:hypothetical protein GCM10010103_77710 [Streptomyces paradoxus]|uniref:Uncharacterized protein n=1 Tax=Streptomyces paradoxus TaxID=66375 RepID=A0A7W9WJQ0_9ACTN|nr:hypothetical protein [Streptomyces paradoxus]MBB6079504.1 hypothetical protein [Streptomyces paradoxus]